MYKICSTTSFDFKTHLPSIKALSIEYYHGDTEKVLKGWKIKGHLKVVPGYSVG